MHARGSIICVFLLIPLCLNAAEGRPKIAVVGLRATGVAAELAENLSSVLASELSSLGLFEVVSRDDIKAMLQFEEEKRLLGCEDASCIAEIGGALGVDRIVVGSLGKVGSQVLLDVRLMNIKRAEVESRVSRQLEGEAGLVEAVRSAARELVGKILQAEAGTLVLEVSEEGAEILIDGTLIGTSPIAARQVAAGPHDLRLRKKGFVEWAKRVDIQPRAATSERAILVPSRIFVEEYESGAVAYRAGAWATLGLAVASAGGSVGLYFAARSTADDNAAAHDAAQAAQVAGEREEFDRQNDKIRETEDDGKLQMAFHYTLMGVGVAAAATSLVLFLVGDPPGKYDGLVPEAGATVAPIAGPSGGGFIVTGRF